MKCYEVRDSCQLYEWFSFLFRFWLAVLKILNSAPQLLSGKTGHAHHSLYIIQVLNGACRLINQVSRLPPAIQRCVKYIADGILHHPTGKLRRSTGCLALSQAERSADTSAKPI